MRDRKMKIRFLGTLLIFILLALPLTAAPPAGKENPAWMRASKSMQIDNTSYIDANRIFMFVTNHGNFGRDLAGVFGHDYGTYFPYSDIGSIQSGANIRSPLYAGGLWIGGVDSASGEVRVIIAEYSDEYVPGPMQGGTFVDDRPEFKVYKLYRDSLASNPNQGYIDYMTYAVNQGAPIDTAADSVTIIPRMVGDQMLWAVYNDADPGQHTNNSGETNPLGLEVRQTTFAFDRQGSLGNVVFLRFQIFNKGSNTIQNCYMSLWADPDLGGAGDDFVGCDTTLSVGYCYNSDNDDQQYSSTPPCLGFDFFQGPLEFTGDMADTGRMWDTLWPGYINIGMVSFNKYINGTDPDNFQETYNYMRGLNRDGSPYIDTTTGQVTTYFLSGDPVAGTGDLDVAPADRRMMLSTGPITFRPGDSTEILAAIVVGIGSDRLNSIEKMKDLDKFAQRTYENGFNPPNPPVRPKVTVAQLPGEITLSWTDTSEVDPGDFEFEGYTVWQGESPTGPWTELATFDVINDRTDALIDTLEDEYSKVLLPVVMRAIKNTGLTYHYRTQEDKLLGGRLRDVNTYYFRVTAFSFSYLLPDSSAVPNGDRFLESQAIVTVVPQAPVAGVHPSVSSMDVLDFSHIGPNLSDGSLEPIVIDPITLNGHTYQVTFEEGNQVGYDHGTPLGIVWHLVDLTTGDTILANQWNQTGDASYQVVDGVLLKVLGPPLLGKEFTYAPSSPLNISPVVLAENPNYAGNDRWFTGDPANGGELLFGAVFLEPNFWGLTSVGPAEYPIVEIRFRPMASYTDLNSDGSYTVGEPYVVDSASQTQGAFMYGGFSGSTYRGFYSVPFTAWDVTDPLNERQLNVVVRDRDGNLQWDLHSQLNDPALPNGGDQRFNYTWILTTDYDPTGTLYGDGTGGTIDFWSYDGGAGVWDAAWTLWLYERGTTRGPLAEQCVLTLVPPKINLATDTFTYVTIPPAVTSTTADLDLIKAVPNPFYLYSEFDPSPGNKAMRFHHLPSECTISIYNIAGDLVRKIQKNDPTTALATWDLLTERGLPVASGIYIYVVDAPGFGQKIGKIAVFTEAEVLKIY